MDEKDRRKNRLLNLAAAAACFIVLLIAMPVYGGQSFAMYAVEMALCLWAECIGETLPRMISSLGRKRRKSRSMSHSNLMMCLFLWLACAYGSYPYMFSITSGLYFGYTFHVLGDVLYSCRKGDGAVAACVTNFCGALLVLGGLIIIPRMISAINALPLIFPVKASLVFIGTGGICFIVVCNRLFHDRTDRKAEIWKQTLKLWVRHSIKFHVPGLRLRRNLWIKTCPAQARRLFCSRNRKTNMIRMQ